MARVRVSHLRTDKGNPAKDQHVIHTREGMYFQSYGAIIVALVEGRVFLDTKYWRASRTTIKYRNKFLGRNSEEVEKEVRNGRFILVDLN